MANSNRLLLLFLGLLLIPSIFAVGADEYKLVFRNQNYVKINDTLITGTNISCSNIFGAGYDVCTGDGQAASSSNPIGGDNIWLFNTTTASKETIFFNETKFNSTFNNFNVSNATYASKVNCAGIQGATSNLCTLTAGGDTSVYNTANNFTPNYDARLDRFLVGNFTTLINNYIPSLWNKANYSAEYAASGFDNENFTTRYETQAYWKLSNNSNNTLTKGDNQTFWKKGNGGLYTGENITITQTGLTTGGASNIATIFVNKTDTVPMAWLRTTGTSAEIDFDSSQYIFFYFMKNSILKSGLVSLGNLGATPDEFAILDNATRPIMTITQNPFNRIGFMTAVPISTVSINGSTNIQGSFNATQINATGGRFASDGVNITGGGGNNATLQLANITIQSNGTWWCIPSC